MINYLPRITFIYDRYHKSSKSKQATVEMRITYNKKQKYISTGIQLYPNQWDGRKVINTADCILQNKLLDKMFSNVMQVIYKMYDKGSIDIFSIPNIIENNGDSISLKDFIRKRIEVRTYGKAKNTLKRYERFQKFFLQWGGIKTFSDINEHNIILYDKYLRKHGMNDCSKWTNYHRFLNSIIIDAIDAGLLKRNPYKWISIDRGRNNDSLSKCLTPQEFHKLKSATMPTECLERVRDLFVFQTYTCLSYVDLRNFNFSKLVDINKMKVYIGNRGKTKGQFTIPMLKPAMEILAKYNNVLPIISNVKYNEYLKVVAQAAGIDKPISTHWARHTGATMLLNEGIDMRIVSKICGHSSTRITEMTYAKLLDETVVNAMKKLDK